ncbi:Lysophospholipase, alpha-beta hydrolase superfamily [Herbiconiux ginsengi]|uniref:Lysophospholipase, alpha-beta hydrolase superfamily n=2 Tax=Herbiconiux ginsengi TaxID=381665 RepID=A0A1H3Q238_9MICO|nr:alpha/beta hydrolase [Herbiconiux ginsengi]SDZ06809.1 Lysophospholipase, alpha-beta hydrolase superfamily [Herbiconiux ginsengi]
MTRRRQGRPWNVVPENTSDDPYDAYLNWASKRQEAATMPTAAEYSDRRRRRRSPRHPASALAERWTVVDDVDVFYRESPEPPAAPVMMHLHGFGLSGRYLLPTAERLRDEFHILVPDLPGFGRSGRPSEPLDVPELAHAATRFLDDRGIERATLVGNSMGCPIICEFAHNHPERIDRAILVSPAGGLHNQPLRRAVGQLARDGTREPPRMMRVAAPDYVRFGVPSTVRMFRALTRYPSLDRLLALEIPTLVVIGDRDPLMPGPDRIREVASLTDNHVLVVVMEGAAHAINFSNPGELAHVIRLFMADQPIVDDPDSPGFTRAYEIHRGTLHPAPKAPPDGAAPAG